ncbi:hypothetical protein K450DRAFT_243296 [Umbelopsis ramanniana AG]|uniref:Uncharacterized protein n=1 Tax=Umbelopsis ramanniana AG TaxID=1314678 RepID=A0AAD5HE58_UMBRA|nr:uncharacterized protein K450DRAFT_243296 [Umbelopsis ramanniana AG]KAI8579211.1 hypothetical protein K450DRAFT_243296 [Umbelopsis ramanniana AG]
MRQQQRPRQQSTSVLNNSEQRLHNQVRHLVHNNPGSKMSRSRNNPTSDHSLSAGYVRDLEQCQESELIDIRKKNTHILGNPTIVATLPDKGEKLRATNIVIDSLLAQLKPDGNFQASPVETAIQEPSDDNDIDDAPLTDAISKLTLKNKENGREHSVALANAQASNNQYVSSGMMRTRKSSIAEGSNNDANNDPNNNARVRMISLNESLQLQDSHQQTQKSQDLRYKLQKLKNHHKDYSLTEELRPWTTFD